MAMIMNEKLIANPAEAVVCTNHCARYSAVFFHLTPTTLWKRYCYNDHFTHMETGSEATEIFQDTAYKKYLNHHAKRNQGW